MRCVRVTHGDPATGPASRQGRPVGFCPAAPFPALTQVRAGSDEAASLCTRTKIAAATRRSDVADEAERIEVNTWRLKHSAVRRGRSLLTLPNLIPDNSTRYGATFEESAKILGCAATEFSYDRWNHLLREHPHREKVQAFLHSIPYGKLIGLKGDHTETEWVPEHELNASHAATVEKSIATLLNECNVIGQSKSRSYPDCSLLR